jgi:hypothetical protein
MRPESKDPAPHSGRFWLAAVAVGALLLSPVAMGADQAPAFAADHVCTTMFPGYTAALATINGGTYNASTNPYKIDSAEALVRLSWLVSENRAGTELPFSSDAQAARYTQTANVDLGGCNWTPIGDSGQFKGTFDGGGFTITGLRIDEPTASDRGMFLNIGPVGKLKNIVLEEVSITGGSDVGALSVRNFGTIESSSASGAVTGATGVGGLVGLNLGVISNSSASVVVTGTDKVGGLVGQSQAVGKITNSSASGAVKGTNKVGGLIGGVFGSTIKNSYAAGLVTGAIEVGGLVGHNQADNAGPFNKFPASIENSYATGAVTGTDKVGGLVGYNQDDLGSPADRVTYPATITNSYATGAVTGTTQFGGLAGINAGTMTNSFWDTQTSLQANSDGGTGKTTAEMQSLITFTGTTPVWAAVSGWLAFSEPTTVWGICGAFNGGYPYLLWQATSNPCDAVSHVVTFNSQDGSAVANGSYVAGGAVVLPAAPTRAGF